MAAFAFTRRTAVVAGTARQALARHATTPLGCCSCHAARLCLPSCLAGRRCTLRLTLPLPTAAPLRNYGVATPNRKRRIHWPSDVRRRAALPNVFPM